MIFLTGFSMGLVGSLHCLGMCGPIVLALPLNSQEKRVIFFQSLLYNLGRITTYVFLGVFMGLIGWGIVLSGYQKITCILLGVVLILSGVFQISLESKITGGRLFRKGSNFIKTNLAKLLSIKNKSSAFKIGLLNGFLPCGMVYIALAGAAMSGSVLSGAFYMMFFGLGTLPMMLGIMFFGNSYKRTFLKFRKWIPLGLILFGLLFVFRGIAIDFPH